MDSHSLHLSPKSAETVVSGLIVCPKCKEQLHNESDRLQCSKSDTSIRVVSENYLDFEPPPRKDAEIILTWDTQHIEDIRRAILDFSSDSKVPESVMSVLRKYQLIALDNSLTELGRSIKHYLETERLQETDELRALLMETESDSSSRFLDVGCSAGALLRYLARSSIGNLHIGVDLDAVALVYADLMTRKEGASVTYCRCNSLSLPFKDQTFSHVICRNALTYMHQRQALIEMTRVLKPGGFLCLRFENIYYDFSRLLSQLRHPKDYRGLIQRGRDFALGLAHHLTGLQPTKHNRILGRAFASARRLKKILAELKYVVIHVGVSKNAPRVMGSATQTNLLARRSR